MADSTMGHVPTNDPTHECGNCGATYTGTISEITAHGWKRHHIKEQRYFTLCDDCEREYAERRKVATNAA